MTSIGLHRLLAGCGMHLIVDGLRWKNPTIGRQGKRPAFGAAHVVGETEEFAHVTNTPCWRFRQIVERFQPSDRRRSIFDQGAGS
jgi:hypothetical protein